jgi:hypothetical protein
MPDDDPGAGQLRRLVSSASAVIAPTTLISGLLFYFGYAFTRARYLYFGVDVDTIGLDGKAYVMRSPTPLLVPLLVLSLVAAAFVPAHRSIRRRIAATEHRDPPADDDPDDDPARARRLRTRYRRLARGGVLAGLAALLGGVALLTCYAIGPLRDWQPFSLVTALLMALGAAGVAYGLRIEALLGRHEMPRAGAWMPLYLVLVASLFWATATIAPWSGRGEARNDARHLDRLPSVILDTKEPLFWHSPSVTKSDLAASPGQSFRYRYRGLRLLIQGSNRMFLIPADWSPSDTTLMVPSGDGVRVQFQFENAPP